MTRKAAKTKFIYAELHELREILKWSRLAVEAWGDYRPWPGSRADKALQELRALFARYDSRRAAFGKKLKGD